MRFVRVLLGSVGLAVFGVAALILVSPGTASLVPVEQAVAITESEYVLVAVFAVVALVVVAAALVARGVGGIDQSTPPDPEDVYRVPRLGADFDDAVSTRLSVGRVLGRSSEDLRGRLRESAIVTVMRKGNCSREEARRRIETGEWTDDRTAAAFLAGGYSPGVGERAVAALRGETTTQRGARHAASAVAAYGGETR